MVAGLLYLIGLIAVLASIALVGYAAPGMYQTFSAAMDAGNQNIITLVGTTLAPITWSVSYIVGGLLLMGVARIIMLLSAINRSLRGQS